MSAHSGWPAGSTPLRAWSAVVILTLAYVVSMIDRMVLAVLLEPLKRDLELTDVQVALLHGTAFAVFYSVVGLPLAWLADRWSRKRIIVLGMLLWSATTMLAGYSRTFLQLFICRMGVGLGEAALTPAASSIFADLFPRARLSRAIGVYMTGGVLGGGIALLVGSGLLQYFEAQPDALAGVLPGLASWQKVLVAVGVPGLLLALVVQAMVRDPRRETAPGAAGIASARGDASLWRHIRREPRPYAAALLGYTCVTVYAYSFFTWTASFLVRRYELAAADAGALFGTLMLTVGLAGPAAAGVLSDRMLARGHALAPVRVMAIGCALLPLPTAVAFLGPGLAYTVVGLSASILLFSGLLMTGHAAMQLIAPPACRATASALNILVSTIVGMGLGPVAVAIGSDHVFTGPAGLGTSLCVVLILAAVLGWMATRLARQGPRGAAPAEALAVSSVTTPGITE